MDNAEASEDRVLRAFMQHVKDPLKVIDFSDKPEYHTHKHKLAILVDNYLNRGYSPGIIEHINFHYKKMKLKQF